MTASGTGAGTAGWLSRDGRLRESRQRRTASTRGVPGGRTMSNRQSIVIVISRGFDDERSSVAWSIASSALASDFNVTIFLVASGVDWVRKGAAGVAHLNPLDPPIGTMVQNLMAGGAAVLACPPCAKVRGYGADDLLDGVTLAGAPAMLERVKAGASTLSF